MKAIGQPRIEDAAYYTHSIHRLVSLYNLPYLCYKHQNLSAMSYVSSMYHIVINTYRREKTISEESKNELYHYIWGIIKRRKCILIRMNAMPEHIHILLELNPTERLSDLMRDIKANSSSWIKSSNKMPLFKGWGKEYAAFGVSHEARERVYNYILNQQEHHRKETFDHEYERLVGNIGMKLYREDE